MAYTDKTYVSNIQDFNDFMAWAQDKKFMCRNGVILQPLDYLYEYDKNIILQSLNEGHKVPLLNTDEAIDYFLIKYCPLQFIQDRLQDVYTQEYYNSVKNGTSRYDTFQRNASNKVKVIDWGKWGKRNFLTIPYQERWKEPSYWVELQHEMYFFTYQEKHNAWSIDGLELGDVGSAVCHKRIKTVKALIRQIKKWKLPKGTIVKWMGYYQGDDIIFKTY